MTLHRLIPVLAGVALLGVLAAPAAGSSDTSVDRALAQVDRSEALVDRSVDAAEAGNTARGYELARTAYLDHFEVVEIPLRLRDPNLVLDLEFQFAQLRDGIRAGEDIAQTKDTARGIRSGLDDVRRSLESKGFAAPALALGFSFSILFREGLEAVLLIAVLLGSLEAARAANYRRPLGWGVLAALAATAITFALATWVIDIAPVNREVLEAATALLAVAVLFAVSFWVISRLEHRHWMEFMRARVSAAVTAGSAIAFAGLGFTAIYREGFETVLFYQALTLFAQGLEAWVAIGALLAAIALVGVGYAIFKLGRRLPVRPLLIAAAAVLMLLSVAFVGNAVRSLQEADVVSITPIHDGWATLPIFLAELTGIHPTTQSVGAQAVLLLIYVLGALYMFAWRPLRRSRRPIPERQATQ
jgi:high-affinity iron transporter